MNIHDCHVPAAAFGDVIGGVEFEAVRMLALLNSEWAELTKPIMTLHKLHRLERDIAQHLAPFVNEDGTYNTPVKGPIKLSDLDLDLEAFLRVLDLCKVWKTRKPRSRRPEMAFLYTEAYFKPLDRDDEERLKRTLSFMLVLMEHPTIATNVVSKGCWLYVIYKYLDATHPFTDHAPFRRSVIRKIREVRTGIKKFRSKIPDHLQDKMYEILDRVAHAYYN